MHTYNWNCLALWTPCTCFMGKIQGASISKFYLAKCVVSKAPKLLKERMKLDQLWFFAVLLTYTRSVIKFRKLSGKASQTGNYTFSQNWEDSHGVSTWRLCRFEITGQRTKNFQGFYLKKKTTKKLALPSFLSELSQVLLIQNQYEFR